MTKPKADPLHITLHVKTAEWGQKKVHLYLSEWKKLAKPVASVVFVKDHKTLGAANNIDTTNVRAVYHENLCFGPPPAWLKAEGVTLENPDAKKCVQLIAEPTVQYIEARALQFKSAVTFSPQLPLKPRIARIGSSSGMYTQYSAVVKVDFGKDKGKIRQMDYKTGNWWNMKQNEAKEWVRDTEVVPVVATPPNKVASPPKK